MAYCRKLSDECEGNADRFMRRSYLPLLTDVRKRLASLCKTDLSSVVLVPNATHVSRSSLSYTSSLERDAHQSHIGLVAIQGVGTVTSNIVWEQDDIVLACLSLRHLVSPMALCCLASTLILTTLRLQSSQTQPPMVPFCKLFAPCATHTPGSTSPSSSSRSRSRPRMPRSFASPNRPWSPTEASRGSEDE